MKVELKNLYNFFDTFNQIYVPIYQRKYMWTNTQCKKLFKDIIQIKEDDNIFNHFLGTSILAPNQNRLNQWAIVDSQQRLTSFSLLMLAYIYNIENEDQRQHYLNKFIVNSGYKTKLELLPDDKKYFNRILLQLNDKNLLKNLANEHDYLTSNIYQNFVFFCQEIKNSNISLDEFLDCIDDVNFVVVCLEQNEDPQMIFESMNHSGLLLSQADLIKNFLLVSLPFEQQEMLYETYWKEIENTLNTNNMFDRFFKYYLQLNGVVVKNEKNIYLYYRNFVNNKIEFNNNPNAIFMDLKNVYNLFMIVQNMELPIYKSDKLFDLKIAINQFKWFKMESLYPIFMRLYQYKDSDYENVVRLMQAINSYIVRATFKDVPSNVLNNFFMKLLTFVNKSNWFIESMNWLLNPKRINDAFIDDNEFELYFKNAKLYENNSRATKAILECLELNKNFQNFNLNQINNLTIEHVFPEGKIIPVEWQEMMGPNYQEIYDKYVHTIGNLTLVTNNPELSNHAFEVKKTMPGGYIDTKIFLNRELVENETWTEREIINRANNLWKVAIDTWKYPHLSQEEQVEINRIKQTKPTSILKNVNMMSGRLLMEEIVKISQEIFGSTTKFEIKCEYENILVDDEIIFVMSEPRKYFINLRIIDPNEILKNNNIPVIYCGDKQNFGSTKTNYTIAITEHNLEIVKTICNLMKQNYLDK